MRYQTNRFHWFDDLLFGRRIAKSYSLRISFMLSLARIAPGQGKRDIYRKRFFYCPCFKSVPCREYLDADGDTGLLQLPNIGTSRFSLEKGASNRAERLAFLLVAS